MASTRRRGERFCGLYRDAQGRQRSAGTFATEEEALARARVAELDARPPEPEIVYPAQKRGKVTVAVYGPSWLDGHRLEAVSKESYGSMMRTIVAGLGSYAVADLDDAVMKRFFRDLEKSGRSSATVGHVRTVLRGMCRQAVKDGILAKMPEMPIGHVRNKEMTIASKAQAEQIRQNVPGHYRLLVRTLFETGMRYGEAMGLGPEHVVLHDSYAVLKAGRRVIVEVGGKPVPKSYGKTSNAARDIVISLDLGERLLACQRDGYLFRAPRGGYLSRSNFRRIWKPAVRAAGVPGLRVHDARHSHASWMANDPRMPLGAVRDRLGHSSLSVTSRYIHDSTPPETYLAVLAA